MEFPTDIVARVDIHARIALSCLIVLALLLIRLPKLRQFEARAYGLAALVGIAAFFNFGLVFHQWDSGFVDRWEQYHYQLGSKYFPELGYDGLYVASLLAQEQTAPELPIERMRDLRTNRMTDPALLEPHVREVRARFSEGRWQSFAADHLDYIENSHPRFSMNVRRDHGYSPSPTWTFVARLFGARLASNSATLGFLGSLDIILLIVTFTVVFRTYGYRIACLGLAIAGLGYGWHYMYIGALLRLDWLAAVVIGLCMLKRERFASAGACLGYATMVRVFPILFLAGPALLALRGWLRGEQPPWARRLAAGFGVVVCLGFVSGSMTGRGIDAWTEFKECMLLYNQTWSTTAVGVDTLFLSGPSFLLENLDAPTERRTQEGVRQALADRLPGRIMASGALLALFGIAVWRAGLAESVVLGMVAIFALSAPSAYYWIMLLALPLRPGGWAPLAVLLLAAASYWIQSVYPSHEYEPWRHALLAWGYALIFVAWLLPDLLQALGRRSTVEDRASGS